MIRSEGWKIALRSGDHRTPPTCASCDGRRETSVVLQASKRSGQLTTILRMKMPYCRACAARVPGAGRRMMILFCLVTILAVALPGVAGFVSLADTGSVLVAAAGAGAALLLAIPAALLLLPKKPAAPSTARGEAVTVTRFGDAGDLDLFCTNGAWAQRFAAANQAPIQPATRYRFVESIAVGWCALLAGAMTFLTWYAAEHPPARPAVAPAASAPASPNVKPTVRPPVAPLAPRKK